MTVIHICDGAAIDGEPQRPKFEEVLGKKKVVFESLISLRADFNAELARTISSL